MNLKKFIIVLISYTQKIKNQQKNIAEQILTDNKTTGASKLNEAKVYENPGVKRMLEIMNKIK